MAKIINHIGVAVPSISEALPFYETILKLEVEGEEIVADQNVKTCFLNLGESRLELLEPTSPDSPIAKFLEKKGKGIHHLAIEVENIEAELQRLSDAGVKLIDKKPRRGAHGTLIAFIHPSESHGVLVELTQRGHK